MDLHSKNNTRSLVEQWREQFELQLRQSPKFKPSLMVRVGDSYQSDAVTAAWDGWCLRAEYEHRRTAPAMNDSALAENSSAGRWKDSGLPVHVHRGQNARWVIQYQAVPNNYSAAFVRSLELVKGGVSASEQDSKTFADDLVSALADNVSKRDLEQIIAAFSKELDTRSQL